MSRHTTAIKTIRSTSRHGTSVNGKPQYRVTFTDGTDALTSSDSAVAYEIQNGEFRGVPVELTLTRAGRIAYARPVRAMSHGHALGYLQANVRGFLEGRRSREELRAALARVDAGVEAYLDESEAYRLKDAR